MTTSVIVIPAYGRDYKTAQEAFQHWKVGKDFKISDVSNRWNDKYCSCRDFGPEVQVKIRYNQLADFCFVIGDQLTEEEDVEPIHSELDTGLDIAGSGG